MIITGSVSHEGIRSSRCGSVFPVGRADRSTPIPECRCTKLLASLATSPAVPPCGGIPGKSRRKNPRFMVVSWLFHGWKGCPGKTAGAIPWQIRGTFRTFGSWQGTCRAVGRALLTNFRGPGLPTLPHRISYPLCLLARPGIVRGKRRNGERNLDTETQNSGPLCYFLGSDGLIAW